MNWVRPEIHYSTRFGRGLALGCCLVLAACSQEITPGRVQWQVLPDDGRQRYRVETRLPVPENLRIALNQGMSLRFRFSARLVEQGHWYRQIRRQWRQDMVLRYSVLTRHYQLQRRQGWQTLAEWREVEQALGRQQWQWPAGRDGLQLEVRWQLDPASLPPSLRLQALSGQGLFFDTGWQVLHGA